MARQTTGYIYQPRKGNCFRVRFSIRGTPFNFSLHHPDGTPITSPKEARAAADALLLPFRVRTEADRLRAMADALGGAEARAERAERELAAAREREATRKARERTEISRCWGVYCAAMRKRGKMASGQPKRGTNFANYRGYVRAFEAWARRRFFGKEPITLADMTADDAQEFLRTLQADGKSNGTYNKYLHFLRTFAATVFEACGLGDLPNPFAKIEGMRNQPKKKDAFTPEQEAAILNAATGELKTICFLGCYTGLRLGDCCTLEWREVDLERRIIAHTPRKTAKSSGAQVKIGIPEPLLAHLAELKAQCFPVDSGCIVPKFAADYNANRRDIPNAQFLRLLERCGLGKTDGNYGFHSFRHAFVTRCIEAGVPLAEVQKLAGHSTPTMTAHYVASLSDEAAAQFADKVFGRGDAAEPTDA